jgi:hypothetical protein
MRKLKLTPRTLAFIIVTRALLAGGVGLLVSSRLPSRVRRIIGSSLIAFGAITTYPALRLLRAGVR